MFVPPVPWVQIEFPIMNLGVVNQINKVVEGEVGREAFHKQEQGENGQCAQEEAFEPSRGSAPWDHRFFRERRLIFTYGSCFFIVITHRVALKNQNLSSAYGTRDPETPNAIVDQGSNRNFW